MPFDIDQLTQHDLLLDSDRELILKFDDDTLYPSIVTNVMARLGTLLSNSSLTLKDGSQDNFKKLRESCRECHVNFDNILDAEIERRIRHGFLMEKNDAMRPIFAHQKALLLTDSHLCELHFGQRLFGIFQKQDYKINKKEDSIDEIETALRQTAERYTEPREHLYYPMLRRALKLIKDDIKKDNLHIQKEGVPPVYGKIVDEISRAENEEIKNEEEETKHGTRCRRSYTTLWNIWKETFSTVVSLAEKETMVLDKEMWFDRTSSKRQCPSAFFNPNFARQSMSGTHEFLERIKTLSPILEFEKTSLGLKRPTPYCLK